MRLANTTKVALRALRRNKMRSLLTALGLIIGVAAVIAMQSIGNGAKSQIEAQIASLGQNVITVFPGNFTSGGMRSGWGGASSLTVEDAEAIAREIPGAIAVSCESRSREQVLANGLNWNTQVQGESPDYLQIRAWPCATGGTFSEQDVRSMAKVAVIGRTVADQLFPNQDPLGQTLRIRNIPFKIVGVLSAKGFNLFGQDQDDVVLVPYSSHMKRVARRTNLGSILVQAASAEQIETVQQQINDLLSQRRNGREPDFTVRNQVEFAQMATATSKTMTVLLLVAAIVSLVVGGIGIMNIMLVSVTERTREIGTRLAVGAHGRDVLVQFLLESVVLSGCGGAIGIGVGIVASRLITHFMGWPVIVPPVWILISFGISTLVGVFFGYYPARKAAQLDPIEALRFE
ncbi:MAG TPA: ABC transporter permease [Opitutaceae bacterium]|nr:ABC transporter permease [Opitutaceae bacterium]